MTPKHFQFLRTLVHRQSGLVLDDEKAYLAENRLAPVARQFGHAEIDQLIENVMATRSAVAVQAVIEAMVTNETYFFRDRKPFEHFADVALSALLKARSGERRLKIWSAAASTGQEPYSLAMALHERRGDFADWRTVLLGTDISKSALKRAEAADYSQFEVQRGLPIRCLVDHFTRHGDRWRLQPAIRRAVRFEPFNLLHDPARLGRFDVIFCRYVLIYFDVETRRQVLERLARQLNPGGYLYLGATESTASLSDAFEPDEGVRGVYRLADAGEAKNAPGRLAG